MPLPQIQNAETADLQDVFQGDPGVKGHLHVMIRHGRFPGKLVKSQATDRPNEILLPLINSERK